MPFLLMKDISHLQCIQIVVRYNNYNISNRGLRPGVVHFRGFLATNNNYRYIAIKFSQSLNLRCLPGLRFDKIIL